MKVTRNVVNDLLPLYEAGEASEDTRALVEEFLRDHRELREEVAARMAAGPLAVSPPTLDPNLERTTLERTRRFFRTRTILLAVAIAGWVVPFLPLYDGHGLWFMWVRNPLMAGAFILASTLAATVNSILGWRHRAEEKHRDASGERGERR